ncbi:MAG: hypothetical protein ACP5QG_03025 [candidate division WOR-3 bacterium]
MIDLSSAYNGKVFLGELPATVDDPLGELALLAPGGPNRKVFVSQSAERAMHVAMARLEGPWTRYGGFVPGGVGTILVDPLEWGKHLPGLAEMCREKRVNLVSDERMTSPGLSGHPFLCEAFGVKPDALLLGKGWANARDFYGFIARPSRLTEPLPSSEEIDQTALAMVIAGLRRRGLEMAREKGRLIKALLDQKGVPARGAGALWLLDIPEPERVAGSLATAGFKITCRENSLVLSPALDLPEDTFRVGLEALGNLL